MSQQPTPPSQGGAAGQRGGRGQQAADPRVQSRTYLFTETNEQIPYAVFVSSKVSRDKKNPLILALHGLGGNPLSLLRGNALDLAEEGGYILVGPMGYNSGGWFGVPQRAQDGAGAGNATPQRGTPQRGAQAGTTAGGTAVSDQAKVRELSEKDVMSVLDMIRTEFNVDERRTYLMGHSMGGAGTIYLGVKHRSNWAAIAAIAPASGGLTPDNYALAPAKDLPVIIVQGDADTAVPVARTRQWVEKLKEQNMTHEYHEIPNGDHGNVITIGMPDIFAFFGKHAKPAAR
jgi:predicted esterase